MPSPGKTRSFSPEIPRFRSDARPMASSSHSHRRSVFIVSGKPSRLQTHNPIVVRLRQHGSASPRVLCRSVMTGVSTDFDSHRNCFSAGAAFRARRHSARLPDQSCRHPTCLATPRPAFLPPCRALSPHDSRLRGSCAVSRNFAPRARLSSRLNFKTAAFLPARLWRRSGGVFAP